MERRLPSQYQGWQGQKGALRGLSTPELIAEIQDGPPDRRLAALSVIDLSRVDQATIEDWIRVLPDPEVNELAGAIPALRAGRCEDHLRWVQVARAGYDRRKLPTFLVMLFSSLEALETGQCPQAPDAWASIGEWLGEIYDRLMQDGDDEALQDLSLFVFENYLDREAVYDALLAAMSRHADLARRVSADPELLLSGLPEQKQRQVLKEAAAAGGLPFKESWATLQGYELNE